MLFRWRRSFYFVPLFTIHNVTYLFQGTNFVGDDSRDSSLKGSIYIVATTVETGEPMSPPVAEVG